MEADLKGYLKCTENVRTPDKRAEALSEYGSTQGARRGLGEQQHNSVLSILYFL